MVNAWRRGARIVLVRLAAYVGVVSALFVALALLPTDAADVEAGADAQRAEELRPGWGLDAPVGQRLLSWWGGAVRGDVGVSWASGRDAADVVAEAVTRTLVVAVPVVVTAAVVGTVVAVVTAWTKQRSVGQAASTVVSVIVGVPEAVWVIWCVAWLAMAWDLVPAVSLLPPATAPWESPDVLVLPMVTLVVPAAAWTAKLLRGVADDVTSRMVVVSARRRGVHPVSVVWHLVAPGVVRAGLPVYAMVTLGVLSGSVVVESVLAYPGIGTVVVAATAARDVPVVMGCLAALTACAVFLLTVAEVSDRRRALPAPVAHTAA